MAEHGTVVDYAEGIVRVEVADAMWMRQMISLGGVLKREWPASPACRSPRYTLN